MVHFGKYYVHTQGLSFLGRLGYYMHGHPHIAKYLQSYYFRKNLKNIISPGTRTVLDVGCGNGDYAFYLAERYPHLIIDAIDAKKSNIINAEEVKKKTKLGNINFIHENIHNHHPLKKYDLIYCVDSLHAIPKKIELFRKINSWLSEGNYFYFQDCRKGGYDISLLPKTPMPFQFYKKNFFTEDQLTEAAIEGSLKRLNFTVVEQKLIIGFFGQLAWEIDQQLQQRNFARLRAFSMPFVKFLCLLDFVAPVGRKNEVCIVARK